MMRHLLFLFALCSLAYGQEGASTVYCGRWLVPGSCSVAVADDLSGHLLRGDLTGAGFGNTAGYYAKMPGFARTTPTSLKVTNPGTMGIKSAITLSAWIWIYADSASDQEIIFKRDSAHGTAFQFFYGGQTSGRVGKLASYDGTQLLIGNATLAMQTWYHVALVIRGTTGSIYINGVHDKSGIAQVGSGVGQDLYIGQAHPDFGAGLGFDGYIVDVRIRNYAASHKEVQTEYIEERSKVLR